MQKLYKNLFKRVLDLVISLLAVAVLSPLILTIIIFLYIVTGQNPFFRQVRPGRKRALFSVLKFKTMNDTKDEKGNYLPDEKRLTLFGKFLRSTSLDEIPQFFNIIKGDMSLVGPRPLLEEYLPFYNDFQNRRHEIRPGVTGWAQVNGRNDTEWPERFKFDIWYIDNVSFLLDLKILLLTIKNVLLAKGINAKNSATMEKFKGNLS